MAALILTILVKGFLVQAFFIPSRRWSRPWTSATAVVVNRLAYRLGDPAHGQVVVFLRPTGVGPVQRPHLLGAAGGRPGARRHPAGQRGPDQAGGGRARRRARGPRRAPDPQRPRVDEPYLRPNTVTSDFKKVRIKPDHLWVMGDNREDSADSRSFGQVHRSTLVGRPC